MTVQGDTPENRDAHHPAHSRPLFLSLRGAQRRGNPAEPSGNPPHRPGIPHHASDWIATSVLFETFLAMTRVCVDCHALQGSQ
jgi:hypothetical protein